MFTCQICGVVTPRWKRCDTHYRCDDCGTRDGLCIYTEGVLCVPCRKVLVEFRVQKFKGDTQHTDEVICPHCGHLYRDSWELDEGEQECWECERKFEMVRYVEVTYSTTKVEKPEEANNGT